MSMIVNPFRFGSPPAAIGSYQFDGSDDSMQLLTSAVTAAPLTISVWANATSSGSFIDNKSLASICDSQFDSFRSRVSSAPRLDAVSFDGATGIANGPTASWSPGTWIHGAAKLTSQSSRQSFFNGVGGGVNTTTITLFPFSRIMIGAHMNGAPEGRFAGKIAHVAVWDIALSDVQIASLAAGANPQSIALSNLKFYAPLNQGVAKDIISNTNLTLNSVPTSNADGPVIAGYP